MAEYRLPTYTMDLPTFIDAKKHELAIDLKVAKLGTIEKYDEKTCTASVKLMTLFDEKTPYKWEYPVLPNVPVVKNKYISHPIKQGDGCLVIFLDSDFTVWLDKGERQAPLTPRLHNLNDPIAIVGIDTSAVIFSATTAGIHSRTTANAPAFSKALTSLPCKSSALSCGKNILR